MRNPRIHTPQPLCANRDITLTDSAANHVGKVLRMRPGDPLILFNGEGHSWQAEITCVSKKQVGVKTLEQLPGDSESPLRIELGQCLSRGERMDYAIQKATELGVTDITLLFSERCEVKLSSERQEKRLQHWQQVAISACEQCGRNRVPTIHAPVSLDTWLNNRNTDLNFVLHHRTEKQLKGFDRPQSVSLLIGPEGGLTTIEIEQAQERGFHPLALGPRVMRTETAPVAAAAVLQYLWGDWN
ncbi:16S rRNA (uracil(1498)-N(3))-methyltransferase [Kistimonas asteriae]|uniref:16S rRNA (uracil(1498)-N(3))-methyltransferase n=1 Tax=Kistimonas asteriae TaxID=517724 RepID=UPI001BAB031B|nr:16S rRNA (uracil(1498)-N(3))-methyltransferase [Kistimonas asteriae]